VVSRFRCIGAFLLIAAICSSLYYDINVSISLRESSGIDEYYSLVSFTPPKYIREYIFSEIQIYPKDFQSLQQKQKPQLPLELDKSDPSSWTDNQRSWMRDEFHRQNRDSVYSLLLTPEKNATEAPIQKSDTVLQWGMLFEYIHEHGRKRHRQGLYEYHDMVGMEFKDENAAIAHRKDSAILKAAWGNNPNRRQKPRVIYEYSICDAFKKAKQIANFQTPHVLITHLNQHWGALSSQVLDRTWDWGDIMKNTFRKDKDGFDCDAVELKELYLDSPYTLAVFTVQHQAIFDHPKVHSIPLGFAISPKEGIDVLRRLKQQKEESIVSPYDDRPYSDPRPNLLMINLNPTPTRKPQMDAVIRNFRDTGHIVKNTYKNYTGNDAEYHPSYYAEMSRSKFVLCPSSIGWDSYAIWEAIAMGAIPVIERNKYRYQTIAYRPDSGKRSKILRTLQKGDDWTDLHGTPITDKILRRHQLTLDVIEYDDGWRKSFDDLPVLWIDGEFGDTLRNNNKIDPRTSGNSRMSVIKYLTPELLEREYDAIAAKMETFRYEKITSIYWIRFMESFLLLKDPSEAHKGVDTQINFDSREEQYTWQTAMKNLPSTFNNHTLFAYGDMSQGQTNHWLQHYSSGVLR